MTAKDAAHYVVESYDYQVMHGASTSDGVVGQGGSSEKIYLHVIAIDAAELAQLGPRIDESGNKQHDRLALPRNEEWWIAVEGDKVWPKTVRPQVTSHCQLGDDGIPRPRPVDDDERTALRKVGVAI